MYLIEIKRDGAIKYLNHYLPSCAEVTMQKLKEPERADIAGNPIDEDDKVPSPFKIYEDKYCSRCQDYRGCIGLIDNLAIKMQNPDTIKGLPDEMNTFLKNILASAGMGSGQRFGLIATCMGARHHMEHRMKTHDKQSKDKKLGKTDKINR